MGAIPALPSPPATPSKTPSVSVTPSITPTISVTPTVTPTISVTPSPSRALGSSPSATPTVTPTVTVTPTISISITPSKTPTVTPTPSPSPDCSQLNIFAQMQQAALQFMQTDIAYYKHNLSQTKRNIYGESLEKWFYQPFLIKCTIERDPDTIKDEMFGPDVEKTIKLTIPKVAWESGNAGLVEGANVLPEIGDIFYDRSTERYYEVHNIIHQFVPINANIGVGTGNCPQAELVTFNIECHQTRVTRLNLSPYKVI
jgi:hypothetical protein